MGKFETRNPKSETNPNDRNSKFKTTLSLSRGGPLAEKINVDGFAKSTSARVCHSERVRRILDFN
jgi:hypothetical protein